MSLQIWLPLTKDTRNQGIMNLPSPWEGWTRDSNGKLGQYCYSDCAIYHITEEWLNNEWSLACWVKSSGWSQYNDILLCKNTSESTSSQFYFSIINGTTLNLGINGGSGGISYNHTFTTNTWYHVAATYNGNVVCLYINGSQVKSQSYVTTKLNGMNNFGVGCRSLNAAGNAATGNTGAKRLNDVRIYNHCLSPMEIKQLSQGLVLHYPLNRGGFGQENLFSQKYWTYSTSGWTGNVISSVAGSTIKPIINSDGSCILTGAGSSGNSQCYLYNSSYRVNLTANKTYTISVLVTSTNISKFRFWWYDYDSSGNRLTTSATNIFTINNGETKLLSYTRTLSENTASCYWELNMYAADTSATLLLHAHSLKLEEGSIVTPWCPNSSDELATTLGLNSTIEYDCSGFCNNGEYYAYDANGSISYTSDTPKYSVSTHIASANPTQNAASGTRYLYGHCGLMNPTQMSVAFWLKPITGGYGGTTSNGQGYFCTTNYEYGNISVGSDYQASAMNHRDGAVNMNDSASTTQCNVTFYPTIGEWHHYVYTYDGQVGRGYKDGVQTATAQFNAAKTLDSFIGVVIGFSKAGGVWRKNDACYSDFRVYATALSADDVKSLYQNCATIDPDGTIRGQIRS